MCAFFLESFLIFSWKKSLKKYNFTPKKTKLYYSKHNIEAIKAATNYENRNGELIKIILISKAGSEGVDFKFIRQVHILEPWYNINRIEQIIGRAVRTCSHKLLPLEKRNVQIFLHGTILNNNTEAVDIYVYRMTEMKVIRAKEEDRAALNPFRFAFFVGDLERMYLEGEDKLDDDTVADNIKAHNEYQARIKA